jgi:tight adherence protein C
LGTVVTATVAALVFMAAFLLARTAPDAVPASRWRLGAAALAVTVAGGAAGYGAAAALVSIAGIAASPAWERRAAARRMMWSEWRDVPDFADLLALNVSAGTPFDRAWASAAASLRDGLVQSRVAGVLGVARRTGAWPAALASLAASMRSAPVQSLFRLLAANLKTGAPVEAALSESAAHLRATYLLELERRAQTLSVRLLVPIVFLILPALLLVLLGPVLLETRGGRFF